MTCLPRLFIFFPLFYCIFCSRKGLPGRSLPLFLASPPFDSSDNLSDFCIFCLRRSVESPFFLISFPVCWLGQPICDVSFPLRLSFFNEFSSHSKGFARLLERAEASDRWILFTCWTSSLLFANLSFAPSYRAGSFSHFSYLPYAALS